MHQVLVYCCTFVVQERSVAGSGHIDLLPIGLVCCISWVDKPFLLFKRINSNGFDAEARSLAGSSKGERPCMAWPCPEYQSWPGQPPISSTDPFAGGLSSHCVRQERCFAPARLVQLLRNSSHEQCCGYALFLFAGMTETHKHSCKCKILFAMKKSSNISALLSHCDAGCAVFRQNIILQVHVHVYMWLATHGCFTCILQP